MGGNTVGKFHKLSRKQQISKPESIEVASLDGVPGTRSTFSEFGLFLSGPASSSVCVILTYLAAVDHSLEPTATNLWGTVDTRCCNEVPNRNSHKDPVFVSSRTQMMVLHWLRVWWPLLIPPPIYRKHTCVCLSFPIGSLMDHRGKKTP